MQASILTAYGGDFEQSVSKFPLLDRVKNPWKHNLLQFIVGNQAMDWGIKWNKEIPFVCRKS